MDNMDWDKLTADLNKSLKTGALVEELAKCEIEKGVTFGEESIHVAIMETNTNAFGRKEIDFQKALMQDDEYNSLHSKMMDILNHHEKTGELDKESLLKIVRKKDNRYYSIKDSIYNN